MKFEDMDTRQWWIGMVIIGSALVAAAMVAKERDLGTVGLGIVAFGFGEWRNHPLQMGISPPSMWGQWQVTSYPRSATVLGTVLNVIGIALIGWGLWRYLTF